MPDPRLDLADLLGERVMDRRRFLAFIRFFDGDQRGYVLCTLEQWQTDLRMVSTVSQREAPVSTLASFVVDDGTPGAVQA